MSLHLVLTKDLVFILAQTYLIYVCQLVMWLMNVWLHLHAIIICSRLEIFNPLAGRIGV